MNCNFIDYDSDDNFNPVSIPNRDFGELQFFQFRKLEKFEYLFQSLIGILVNCNAVADPWGDSYRVSIPNRDFGELQWRGISRGLFENRFNP